METGKDLTIGQRLSDWYRFNVAAQRALKGGAAIATVTAIGFGFSALNSCEAEHKARQAAEAEAREQATAKREEISKQAPLNITRLAEDDGFQVVSVSGDNQPGYNPISNEVDWGGVTLSIQMGSCVLNNIRATMEEKDGTFTNISRYTYSDREKDFSVVFGNPPELIASSLGPDPCKTLLLDTTTPTSRLG